VSRRIVGLIALVGAGLGLASCGGDDGGRKPTAAVTRRCTTRVEGKLPLDWRRSSVIAGPLAFAGARVFASPRIANDRKPGRVYAEKVLAVVEAEHDVIVSVDRSSLGRVRLLYELERLEYPPLLSHGTRDVRLVSCEESEPSFDRHGTVGPETQFNGGFLVRWPACARLKVTDADSAHSLSASISFGPESCSS
jgi:hypothetical protein